VKTIVPCFGFNTDVTDNFKSWINMLLSYRSLYSCNTMISSDYNNHIFLYSEGITGF
jgi:hypothetical protein